MIDWKVGVTHLSSSTVPAASRTEYWLNPGHGANRSAFHGPSVHPPIIVKSFSYTKLARR